MEFEQVFNPKPVKVCIGKAEYNMLPLPIVKLQDATERLDKVFRPLAEGKKIDMSELADALSVVLQTKISEGQVEQMTMPQLLFLQQKFLEVNGLGEAAMPPAPTA